MTSLDEKRVDESYTMDLYDFNATLWITLRPLIPFDRLLLHGFLRTHQLFNHNAHQ